MIDFFSLRTNSEFQMSKKLRDYAINDYWMARAGLWRLTQGVYDRAGSIVYEKIADLVKNIADVDLCDVKQLQSLSYELNITSGFGFIEGLPSDVYDLLNILSIKQNFFLEPGKAFTENGVKELISQLGEKTGLKPETLYSIAERYEAQSQNFINASNVLLETQPFEYGPQSVSAATVKSFHGIQQPLGEFKPYLRVNNSTKLRLVFKSSGGDDSVSLGNWEEDKSGFENFSSTLVSTVSEAFTAELSSTKQDNSIFGACILCKAPVPIKFPASRPSGRKLQDGDFIEIHTEFEVDTTSVFIPTQQFIEEVIYQSYYNLLFSKLNCEINAGNDANFEYLKDKFLKFESSLAYQQDYNDGNINFEYYETLLYSNFCANVTNVENLPYNWFLESNLPNVLELELGTDDPIDYAAIVADVARILTDITITLIIRREVLKSVAAQYSKIGTNTGVEKVVGNYFLRNYTSRSSDWDLDSKVASVSDSYLPTLSKIGDSFNVDLIEYWDETDYLNISAESDVVYREVHGVEEYKAFDIGASGQLVSSIQNREITYLEPTELPLITGGNDRFWEDPDFVSQMREERDSIIEFYQNVDGAPDGASSIDYINAMLSSIWDVHAPSSWDEVNHDIQLKYFGGPSASFREAGLYPAINVGNPDYPTVAPAVNLLGLSEMFGSLDRDYQSVVNDDRPVLVEAGNAYVPGYDVYLPWYPGIDADYTMITGLPPDISPEASSNFVYTYREYFQSATVGSSIIWQDEIVPTSGVESALVWNPSTFMVPSTEMRVSTWYETETGPAYRTEFYLDAVDKQEPFYGFPVQLGYYEPDPEKPESDVYVDYMLYGSANYDVPQISGAYFTYSQELEPLVYDDATPALAIFSAASAFIPETDELLGVGDDDLVSEIELELRKIELGVYPEFVLDVNYFSYQWATLGVNNDDQANDYEFDSRAVAYGGYAETETDPAEPAVTFAEAINNVENVLTYNGYPLLEAIDLMLKSGYYNASNQWETIAQGCGFTHFTTFTELWNALKGTPEVRIDGQGASYTYYTGGKARYATDVYNSDGTITTVWNAPPSVAYDPDGTETGTEGTTLGTIFKQFVGLADDFADANGLFWLAKSKQTLLDAAAELVEYGTLASINQLRTLTEQTVTDAKAITDQIIQTGEYNQNLEVQVSSRLSELPQATVSSIFSPSSAYSLDVPNSVIHLGSAEVFDRITSVTNTLTALYEADIEVPSSIQVSSVVQHEYEGSYTNRVSTIVTAIVYESDYRDVSITAYKINSIPGAVVDERLEFGTFDSYGGLVNSWRNVNVELRGYQSCYEASPNLDMEYDVNKFIDIDGPWIGEALYSLMAQLCTDDSSTEPDPNRLDAAGLLSEYENDGTAKYANSDRWYLIQYVRLYSFNVSRQLITYVKDILALRQAGIAEFEVDAFGNNYTLYKDRSLSSDWYDVPGTVWMRYAQFPFSFPLLLPPDFEGERTFELDQINIGITVKKHRYLAHHCLTFGTNNNVLWMAGYDDVDASGNEHFNVRIYANANFEDAIGRSFYGIRNPRKLFAFNGEAGMTYKWENFFTGFFDQSKITFVFWDEQGFKTRAYNLVTERIDSKERIIKFPVESFASTYAPAWKTYVDPETKKEKKKNPFRLVEDNDFIYCGWLTTNNKLSICQIDKDRLVLRKHLLWNVPESEIGSELDKFSAGSEVVKVRFKSGGIYYARLSASNFNSNERVEDLISVNDVDLKYIAYDLALLEEGGNNIVIPRVPIIDITQWRHWCYSLTTNTLYTMQYEPALLISAVHDHIENKNYTHTNIEIAQLFIPGNCMPQDIVSYKIGSGAYLTSASAQVLTGWDINFSWNSLTDRLQKRIPVFAPHYAVTGVEPSQSKVKTIELNNSASAITTDKYVGLPYNVIYSERTDYAENRKALEENRPSNFYNYLALKNFYNYAYEHEYNWGDALGQNAQFRLTGWRRYLKCGISKFSDAMWLTYNYLRDPEDYSNFGKQRAVAAVLNDYEWVELVYGTIQLMNNAYSKSNVFSLKFNDSTLDTVTYDGSSNEERMAEIEAKEKFKAQVKQDVREFIDRYAPARTQLWKIDFDG